MKGVRVAFLVSSDLEGRGWWTTHVQDDERLSVASRKCRAGLDDAVLCAGRLARVAGNEVVARLFGREPRDGREDTVGVARQEDEVRGLRDRTRAELVVLDVLDRL